MRFGLPAGAFETAFPFRIVFDRHLVVRDVGTVLLRLVPELHLGACLLDHFCFTHPANIDSFDAVARQNDVLFVARAKKTERLIIKGQMIPIESGELMAFLASPKVSDLSELESLDLSLTDFAIHDPTGDLLFLAQARASAVTEATRLADDLTEMTEWLEQEVQKRTGAMAASETRYRALFERNPEPMWVFDAATYQFLDVNDAAVERYGFSRHEFLRMRITDIRPSEDVPVLLKRLGEIEGNESYTTSVRRHRTKSGEILDVEVASHALTFGDRKARVAVARDVSARRLAEQTQHLLATVVESSEDAITAKSLTGTILSWNRAAEQLYGYSAAEAIGQPISMIIPPDRAGELPDFLAQLARGEHIQHYETLRRHKNGRLIPVSLTLSPIYDEQGAVNSASTIARDITALREAQRALEESEQRMRFALEAAGVGVWEMDLSNSRLYWSRVAEAMHGLPEGAFDGSWEMFLACLTRDSRERAVAGLGIARGEGSMPDTEYETIWSDGSIHTISSMGRFQLDENDVPIRATGIVADITDRRSLEEKLRQASKMEAIGQLAGGVAHDFNNLLTIILASSDFLRAALDKNDPSLADAVAIQDAAQRAAQLTQQLLAFGRKQILRAVVLELGPIVSDLSSMLRRLLGETIDLRIVTAERSKVLADAGQIGQVVMNLAINARDAMPDGGRLTIDTADVALDAEAVRDHPTMTPGRYVMIALTDTGHGMDATTRQRIFEPFFTTKAQGRGTGLGLSTAYGIVKQSGGYIWVYSEVGRGTTFKVYLPVIVDDERHTEPVLNASCALQGSETILVIEDEEVVRSVVEKGLRHFGYTVHTTSSPQEAIEFASRHAEPIDLILTDVVLPQMSGRAVAEQITTSTHHESRVLYMSGYTDAAIVHHGVLEEGLAFLQKPFTTDVLARKVREVLER